MTRYLFFLLFSALLLFSYNARADNYISLYGSPWPPFEYEENGAIKGTDVDIIREAFQRMSTKLQIKIIPWKRCILYARKKTADGIFTLRKTPEREAFLIFTKEPVNYSENVFFLKKGKPYQYDKSLESLKGLRIGITAGYNYGESFMKSKLYQLDEAGRDDSNFKKLLKDRIDLFICDKIVGSALLKQMGYQKEITTLPLYFSRFEMYLGFSKKPGNEKLAEKFSKTLEIMKKDGTYQKIIDTYIR